MAGGEARDERAYGQWQSAGVSSGPGAERRDCYRGVPPGPGSAGESKAPAGSLRSIGFGCSKKRTGARNRARWRRCCDANESVTEIPPRDVSFLLDTFRMFIKARAVNSLSSASNANKSSWIARCLPHPNSGPIMSIENKAFAIFVSKSRALLHPIRNVQRPPDPPANE